MAMKPQCISAVSKAIGRQITQAESVKIEERILRNMRVVASQDPAQWRTMTQTQRMTEAAKLAGEEIVAEADRKKRNIELSIQAHDKNMNYIDEQVAKGMNPLDALERQLVFKSDGKSNTMSVETASEAIRADAVRQLVDTFEAVDPRFWGLFESNEGITKLTKAIFGEKVGDALVEKGAKAWLDVAEQLRTRFNNGGGKIGKLMDWAVPQHHSQTKVANAGVDKWVADVFGKLDRNRYTDDQGLRLGDQAIIQFLREAYMSIATGGLNDFTPGAKGEKALANRRAFHREIHFKDADSYLDYQKNYGEKTLWGVMTDHVTGLSKDIAMLEQFGPNARNTFQLLAEKALQQDALLNPKDANKSQKRMERMMDLFDFTTGRTKPVVNQTLAQSFDTLRNWLIGSRLGSAVITALADEATVHLTARINKLPEVQLFANELASLNLANKTEENLAHRAGLGIDTMISHLNRWGQENLGSTFSSKMASTVMRASGMEALDGARRRAFGVTMMSALGEMAGKYGKLADIDQHDYRILLSKGITETDWQVWKLADLEQWGAGNGVLTPESIKSIPDSKLTALGITEPTIAKQQAITRLLGVTLEETNMAVIRPGMTEKFVTSGQFQRGTWGGELARSFFLFKSFPIAMIYRHWMRGLNMETTGGKAMYIASLTAGTTVLGAVSQIINDFLSGKDPRNYNPAKDNGIKNWIGAMLKGGSLGIYGDFLFSEATQHSNNGVLGSMLGPVAGLAEEFMGLTQGNLIQLAQGKDTHFGAEVTRFIKGNLPASNLWYAKGALDHLIFQQLQEYFAPGYLARMERRAQKEFGQTYYWQPGTNAPQRAPNFAKAVGE